MMITGELSQKGGVLGYLPLVVYQNYKQPTTNNQ
jgi:hypothetical protein